MKSRCRKSTQVSVALLSYSAVMALAGCCVKSNPPTFAEEFATVENLMTQAEVVQALGSPATKRSGQFPSGQFMGPQEGMIGVIAPGQAYQEWEYTSGGDVYLIFFAGELLDDPPNQWNVVGKTQYPQGAVF